MPRTGEGSELGLEIDLLSTGGAAIRYRTAGGEVWVTPAAGPPPSEWGSWGLWEELVDSWDNRQASLFRAGRELGRWLCDDRACDYLRERRSYWATEDRPRRIELRLPGDLASWPFECVNVEGIGFLAVDEALAFVRVADSEQPCPPAPEPPLSVHLVGVDLAAGGRWKRLRTEAEVERVREEIGALGDSRVFDVRVDGIGAWSAVSGRPTGAPDVLHFVGHGLPGGRGLVFRREDGTGLAVDAEEVAGALTDPEGRPTRLVFLNACPSVSGGRTVEAAHQPFDGIGARLVERGIPLVVGLQCPARDREARVLTSTLYGALARGEGLDQAVQTTRRVLFFHGGDPVSWVFLHATVRVADGRPAPLWQPRRTPGPPPAIDDLSHLAHGRLGRYLTRLLQRERPCAVVIHGPPRAGQRYVIERLRRDLSRTRSVLWRPVTALSWGALAEPRLARSQLAGGIARALSVGDRGDQSSLEARIAEAMAEHCRSGSALVVDVTDVLQPAVETEVAALWTLVGGLWADLVEAACRQAGGDELPAFLLVSVAHGPREERAGWTRAAVEELRKTERPSPGLRVEVVDELSTIEEADVVDYLQAIVHLGPVDARRKAVHVSGGGDNEAILDAMRDLIAEI